MKKELAPLLDADIVTYRCGFSAEQKIRIPYINGQAMPALHSAKELKEFLSNHQGEQIDVEHRLEVQPVSFALGNVKTTLHAIEDVVGKFCGVYLTGRGNFREQTATILPYKGQRSEFAKPTHYQEIRNYLQNVWKAQVIDGQEADDAIGIEATRINSTEDQEAVIVSIDKDLDTIPGLHYNWVSGAKYRLSPVEALRNFYAQMLEGDRTDNIPGIEGIGPKTAKKMLEEYTKEYAMFSVVRDAYHKHYPQGMGDKSTDEALLEIGRLLYIRKQEGEIWEFPSR